jgi:hypothetical protein
MAPMLEEFTMLDRALDKICGSVLHSCNIASFTVKEIVNMIILFYEPQLMLQRMRLHLNYLHV